MVKINTTGVSPGKYSLTLESFDLNSSVYSTLKTDEIKVEVIGAGASSEATVNDYFAKHYPNAFNLDLKEDELGDQSTELI